MSCGYCSDDQGIPDKENQGKGSRYSRIPKPKESWTQVGALLVDNVDAPGEELQRLIMEHDREIGYMLPLTQRMLRVFVTAEARVHPFDVVGWEIGASGYQFR